MAEVSSARVRLTARNWGMAAWDDRQVHTLEAGQSGGGRVRVRVRRNFTVADRAQLARWRRRSAIACVVALKSPTARRQDTQARPAELSGAYGEYATVSGASSGGSLCGSPDATVLEVPAGLTATSGRVTADGHMARRRTGGATMLNLYRFWRC